MSDFSNTNTGSIANPSKRPRRLDSTTIKGDGADDHGTANNLSNTASSSIVLQQQQQQQLVLPAADIIRLVLSHLTECGLHESTRMLQQESGIGFAAITKQQHDSIRHAASSGQWGVILQLLSLLDRDRRGTNIIIDISLVAAVHEITILELAELGEWEIAFSNFRLLQQNDEISNCSSEIALSISSSTQQSNITVSRSLEQKLAHLMAERDKDPACAVPNDFYGVAAKGNQSNSNYNNHDRNSIKQLRRDALGIRLQQAVPIQPVQRLPTLLQQAMKWQSYTGQVPTIRRMWNDTDETVRNDNNHNMTDETKHQTKPKNTRQEFDLVLGEVTVDDTVVGSGDISGIVPSLVSSNDPYISGIDYAVIKFGKNATAEVMTFLPDGTGLVTGSSDGLIEIWNPMDGTLRTHDLLYQQNDELIGHHDTGAAITAIAISNDTTLVATGAKDGIIHIWRFDTGKCLRTIQTTAAATTTTADRSDNSTVGCICFSPESSHILAGMTDGTCREFGLRTSRMLKEFRGHTSYITICDYHLLQLSTTTIASSDHRNKDECVKLLVVTASGDGTVRIWDGKTMDVISVLQPISVGLRNDTLSQVGASIATVNIDRFNQTSSNEGSPSIHSILKLHTPVNTMVIVPRGQCAFLVDFTGRVLRKFQEDKTSSRDSKVETCYVAATVNSTNRWLYLVRDDGIFCIFDIHSGKCEHRMNDFGVRSISSSSSTTTPAEITSIAHHPTNGIIAAFSNSKGQKRGKVALWK